MSEPIETPTPPEEEQPTPPSLPCDRCGRVVFPRKGRSFAKRTFCGLRCLGVWLFARIIGFLRCGGKKAFRLFRRIPLRLVAEGALVALLVLTTVRLFRLERVVRRLSQPMIVPAVPLDTSAVPLPATVEAPISGGMVLQNTLDITGSAEENWILALAIDGRLERVQLPQTGRFVFERVPLRRGQNTIEIRAIHPSGEVHVIQTLTVVYGPPLLSHLMRDLRRGPTDRKTIALTFDGGSSNNIADEILDYLKESGVKATFFLTGEFIRRYPQTVRRIADEGHVVGNHTWSHPHLTTFAQNGRHETLPTVSPQRIREELEKTAALYTRLTGKTMSRIWRAPYGEVNPEILRWAAEAGYRHVGWTTGRGWRETMDTLDWVADPASSAYYTAQEITEKILDFGRRGANGAILLMHLGSERAGDYPHARLPEIIQGLKAQGYRLVTIDEMVTLE